MGALSWLLRRVRVAPACEASPRAPESQLSEAWTSLPLLSRVWVDEDCIICTFGLPDGNKTLGSDDAYIPCVLARGGIDGETGEPWVRPYTPMEGSAVGKFTLNVRVYERGSLSRHLADLAIGERLDFSTMPPDLYTRRFVAGAERVGVVCAGTGITSAFAAVERLLRKSAVRTIAVLYGSRTESSILRRADLDALEEAFPGVLAVTHCLSREPADSKWAGHRGRVDRRALKRHLPPPGKSVLVYVCGPDALCDALCGPPGNGAPAPLWRRRPRGVLGGLGYGRDQVCRL